MSAATSQLQNFAQRGVAGQKAVDAAIAKSESPKANKPSKRDARIGQVILKQDGRAWTIEIFGRDGKCAYDGAATSIDDALGQLAFWRSFK
jgi:hypothetical protein